MTSRLARTILIILILAMPVFLWATKVEQMQSMSAYALAPNALFYRAMHVLGSWLFLIEGQKFKRHIDMGAGICMGMILIVDMYFAHLVHNLITLTTMIFAITSIIYYSDQKNRPTNILLGFCAAGSFIVGLSLPMQSSVFWGEMFAMFCVAVSRARRVWIHENA